MKELKEYLVESLSGLKTKKVSGNKHVKAVCKEMGVDIDIKSSKWNVTKFNMDGSDITAYWSTESTWIFYYYGTSKNWAAVAGGEIECTAYSEDLFKNFEDFMMNGATIPEFDSFDTNLE